MEKYFAAKRLLFDGTVYPAPRVAVINAHDDRARAARRGRTQSRRRGPHLRHRHGRLARRKPLAHARRRCLRPRNARRLRRITSRLAGEVNILNLLAALAAAHARGVAFDDLIKFAPSLRPVPGRFQPVDAGQPFTVIVDYAHTDDALRNLITLARQMTASSGGRVITLFGCGGDRDRTKRPKMGQAAGEGSDFVVATSDNPRSEDPLAILAEIEPALKATGVRYTIEPDRAAAIRLALEAAKPSDVVLIAGKGHEKEQILASGSIPFDDSEIALSTLAELGYGEVR